jgi:POT family proton-dependent oligopeptide transporter
MASQIAQGPDHEGTILGHPKGLFVLFFAEMWERFSYYGMRALLIFYLTKHWLYSDEQAGIIYGAYTALVYITPVLGGYLADRYLGQRKAVLFGAVLLTLGHFFMAFEGEAAAGHTDNPAINVFWLALALIIVGSGFLKANISVIVGQLYPRTDVRRDAAYTIFYMGINLGAAIGALLCGYIGEVYGWKYGFGLAGIGMLAGLAVFVWGKPLLLGRGEPPRPLAARTEWTMYGAGIGMVALCWAAVQYQSLVGYVLGLFGGALVLYVLFTAVTKLSPEERDRIFAAMFLIVTSIMFWALFEQAGSSLNLFTDRHVDRVGVPASVFQSINAIYIILLAPVFAAGWQMLGRSGREPSAPFKFGLGVIQVGLGFLVLVWGARAVGLDVPTPVILIFVIYLLHTTGELCLSPVGLSAMNRLAPAHMASLIMGTWFFASATGNFAAGLIAAATGAEGVGEEAGKAVVLDVYSTVGWVAVGVGIAVLLVSPLIKKLMHLDTLKDEEDDVRTA